MQRPSELEDSVLSKIEKLDSMHKSSGWETWGNIKIDVWPKKKITDTE